MSGPQGNKWLSAQVPLQSDDPFYIYIDGFVGGGSEADIAIDSISINNNSSCSIIPSIAEPSNSSNTCTFEKGNFIQSEL